MPLGRSRPGDGRSSGKIMGLALLPVVFLAWTQPPPPRLLLARRPSSALGPHSTICPPGALPHQGL